MTEAEYKKETTWYKRFMSAKSINPQPKAVREALYMVTPLPQRTTCTGDKPFYVAYASAGRLRGDIPECYSSLANYWTERLKKS